MTDVLDATTAAAPRTENVRPVASCRAQVAPLTANADAGRAPVLEVAKNAVRPAGRERVDVRFLSRIRAWMVVPVVDFALLMAPLAWRPPQIHAIVTMAVLGTFLLTGGGRYVAPLHLSVLDELPSIVTRLLTAVAAVSAAILYLHQRLEVLIFLETACQAVVLVIVGRFITTRLIALVADAGLPSVTPS